MPIFTPLTNSIADPIFTGPADTGLGQLINHATNALPVPEPMIICYLLLIVLVWVINIEINSRREK